jgi:prepilin-type N-terminal cleavage/methylation domain-containing protein
MNGMNNNRLTHRPHPRERGFSMTELVVVIAVLGVLAAIAIPHFAGLLAPAKVTVARNLVETLNGAVHRFNQTNYELATAVVATGEDEILVLRTLQYRHPDRPKPGSPYMPLNWSPVTSSASADYRVIWMGNLYKLLEPGQSGTGIKVDFEGGDVGRPYVFPPAFTMAGQ